MNPLLHQDDPEPGALWALWCAAHGPYTDTRNAPCPDCLRSGHVHKWVPDPLAKSMLPAYKCACGAKR